MLQLRSKSDDRTTVALARQLAAMCREAAIPFVMNDRVDLAILVGADGVHLGQHDLPLADARRLFKGPIGVSTHDLLQARAADAAGADLVAFGPIFSTQTKADADPTVGLSALVDVCEAVDANVVAIGGIGLDDAHAVRNAGAHLVAAISAVCGAEHPEASARRFHEVVA